MHPSFVNNCLEVKHPLLSLSATVMRALTSQYYYLQKKVRVKNEEFSTRVGTIVDQLKVIATSWSIAQY